MIDPIYVELEVSQAVRRDGTKGDEKWSLHVFGNGFVDEHGVDPETAEQLKNMSDRDVMRFVETLGFAHASIEHAREYGDGVHIFGEFVSWETLDAVGPAP